LNIFSLSTNKCLRSSKNKNNKKYYKYIILVPQKMRHFIFKNDHNIHHNQNFRGASHEVAAVHVVGIVVHGADPVAEEVEAAPDRPHGPALALTSKYKPPVLKVTVVNATRRRKDETLPSLGKLGYGPTQGWHA